jgi:hypothetical protein
VLVVVGIVVAFLVVAAVVDLHARRRGSRTSGKAYAASMQDHRRDLRSRRSMLNLGADTGGNPYSERQRR